MTEPTPLFDDQIIEVLDRLSQGQSLRFIAKQPGMPKPSTFLMWVGADSVLAEHYTRAREAGMDQIGEEIIEIADATTAENAQANRLRYDARRWYLSKLAPKRYGEKVQHTGADGDGPVQFERITRTIVDPHGDGG